MMEQCYFETGVGRVRAPSAKRQTRIEARKQNEIDCKKRTATQIRRMIANLEHEIACLAVSIASELEQARVREPSHFGYPMLVRAMQIRNDNLKATVASLSDRLALIETPPAMPPRKVDRLG
ncbi:MAG: hypothetical protein ACREEK_20215 [Bradyrhizobium sp.]